MKLWLSEHEAYVYRTKGYKVCRVDGVSKAGFFQWRDKVYQTELTLWEVIQGGK
jgi:hypothetical protein